MKDRNYVGWTPFQLTLQLLGSHYEQNSLYIVCNVYSSGVMGPIQ